MENLKITLIDDSNRQHFSGLLYDDIPQDRGVLGVLADDIAVGAAVFDMAEKIPFLEHIYVEEEYRRKGVGTFIIDRAADLFEKKDLSGMMVFYEEAPGLTEFFRSLGFACVSDMPICHVSRSNVLASEKYRGLLTRFSNAGIIPFDKLKLAEKKAVIREMLKAGFDVSLLEPGAFDDDISFAYVKDDKVHGVLLASHSGGDTAVTMMMSMGDDQTAVIRLMVALMDASKDEKVLFLERNEKLVLFIEKLLGGEVPIERSSRMWQSYRSAVNDVIEL